MAAAAIVIFPLVVSRADGERGRLQVRIALSLTIGAMIFLFLTLRSQRHVEYFVPLAVAAVRRLDKRVAGCGFPVAS